MNRLTSAQPFALAADDLLLRETNHRCSNDLQLVVSLLALQSRRAICAEARAALTDAMERVGVLARCRIALQRHAELSLGAALRQTCEALHAQCEPRAILVSLEVADEGQALSATQVTTLTLVVNELATNAIKHAFRSGVPGHIAIRVTLSDARDLVLTIDDDGLPFPELERGDKGLGLGLVRRLVGAAGGQLVWPAPGTKRFEIRVPGVAG